MNYECAKIRKNEILTGDTENIMLQQMSDYCNLIYFMFRNDRNKRATYLLNFHTANVALKRNYQHDRPIQFSQRL